MDETQGVQGLPDLVEDREAMPDMGTYKAADIAVRCEIDRPINVDRQISIHLNYAMEVAFVPIVTAPRLIGHVLDGETLVRRKRNVRQRPGAAFLDRELKHGIELRLRNHKRLSPFLVALPQRPFPRNPCFQFGKDLIEVRIRKSWRNGVVKCARFVVELEFFELQHPHTRRQRGNLFLQIFAPQLKEVVASDRSFHEGRAQFSGLSADRIQRLLFLLRLRLPLRRPVKRVDIIGIMLPQGQHEMRVPLGCSIHVVCRSRAATRH